MIVIISCWFRKLLSCQKSTLSLNWTYLIVWWRLIMRDEVSLDSRQIFWTVTCSSWNINFAKIKTFSRFSLSRQRAKSVTQTRFSHRIQRAVTTLLREHWNWNFNLKNMRWFQHQQVVCGCERFPFRWDWKEVKLTRETQAEASQCRWRINIKSLI